MGLRLAHLATFLAACLLSSASLPFSARAQPAGTREPISGPFALHWVRLPGTGDCIAGDALAREVESTLNRKVFPASRDAEVLIEGHVERRAEGYRAELRMTGSDGRLIGSRALSSAQPNCRELSETLSVVLAVMIDPDAEARAKTPQPVQPKAEAKAAPARDPNDAANHLLGFGRLSFGVVPEQMYGIGVAYERWLGRGGGLRLEGVSFVAKRLKLDDPAFGDAEISVRLGYAGLAYCPLWLRLSRVRLAGCVGGELGAISAQGSNFERGEESARRLWLSGSAALRFAVRLVAALELSVGASALVAGKYVFTAGPTKEDATPVMDQTSGFGGNVDLGLGARF